VGALTFNVEYIQPIESELECFTELFNPNSLVLLGPSLALTAIKPGGENAAGKPKPSRLTTEEKAQLNLSTRQEEILVGCILGDLNVQKRYINGNAKLRFVQGLLHKEYLEHLYTEFESYCTSAPLITRLAPDKRTGKVYSSIRFNTLALPCFNKFFVLFYPNGQKIVPQNIGELLTLVSLAY
jgi:hypothetical protein